MNKDIHGIVNCDNYHDFQMKLSSGKYFFKTIYQEYELDNTIFEIEHNKSDIEIVVYEIIPCRGR